MAVVACRVCLATDCKLYSLDKHYLKSVYYDLTSINISTSDGLPQYICYVCNALLLKYSKFRTKCQETHCALEEIVSEGTVLTPELMLFYKTKIPPFLSTNNEDLKIFYISETESSNIDDKYLKFELKDEANEHIKVEIEIKTDEKDQKTYFNKLGLKHKDEENIIEKTQVIKKHNTRYRYRKKTVENNLVENKPEKPNTKVPKQSNLKKGKTNSKKEITAFKDDNFQIDNVDEHYDVEFLEDFDDESADDTEMDDPNIDNCSKDSVKVDHENYNLSLDNGQLYDDKQNITMLDEEIDNFRGDNVEGDNNSLNPKGQKDESTQPESEAIIIFVDDDIQQNKEIHEQDNTEAKSTKTEAKSTKIKAKTSTKRKISETTDGIKEEKTQNKVEKRLRSDDDDFFPSYAKKYNMTLTYLTKEERIKKFNDRRETKSYKNAKHKCEICFTGFLSMQAYEKHVILHNKTRGRYKCDVCQMYFANKESYNHHWENHSMTFTCNVCQVVFDKRQTLRSHFRIHTDEKYECIICHKLFGNQSSYNLHLQKHNAGIKCGLCGQLCSNEHGLTIHMNYKHEESLKCMCDKCEVYFEDQGCLQRHIESGCAPNIKACPRCGEGFINEKQLAQHTALKHNQKKKYICEICNKSYDRAKNLGLHWRYMHDTQTKILVCEFCGLHFRKQQAFDVHMRTHTGEKPHVCEHCGTAFRILQALKNHMYSRNCAANNGKTRKKKTGKNSVIELSDSE